MTQSDAEKQSRFLNYIPGHIPTGQKKTELIIPEREPAANAEKQKLKMQFIHITHRHGPAPALLSIKERLPALYADILMKKPPTTPGHTVIIHLLTEPSIR